MQNILLKCSMINKKESKFYNKQRKLIMRSETNNR